MTNITKPIFSQVNSSIMNYPLIEDCFNFFNVKRKLQLSKVIKQGTISPITILIMYFIALFQQHRSIKQALSYYKFEQHKTVMNDFINNNKYNFRRLLNLIAVRFTKKFKADSGKTSYFIIDCTPKKKTGRKVQYISRLFDTTNKCFYYGYEALIAAWHNGRSIIPFDFALKIGNKKRRDKSPHDHYQEGSHTFERVQEAMVSKVIIAISMIRRALKMGITINYVLWDSDYTCVSSLAPFYKEFISKGVHLVAKIKRKCQKLRYEEEELYVKEIVDKAGKWEIAKFGEKKRKYKMIKVEVTESKGKKRVVRGEAILFASKDAKCKKNDYGVIISTDISLTAKQIHDHYYKRHHIEVLNKDLKSYFGFDQAKSSNYSAQIGHLTLISMFYIMVCALKDRSGNLSAYSTLFDVNGDFNEYCLENYTRISQKNAIEEFIDFVDENCSDKGLSKMITTLNELYYIYQNINLVVYIPWIIKKHVMNKKE